MRNANIWQGLGEKVFGFEDKQTATFSMSEFIETEVQQTIDYPCWWKKCFRE